MSAKQISFALTTEGPSDLQFLSEIVRRAIEECVQQRFDADVLPCTAPTVRPVGATFTAWMERVQAENSGVSLIFVHQDCDAPNADNVHSGRWLSWCDVAEKPYLWVPILPCRAMESWLLADDGLLGQELRLPEPELDSLRQHQTADSIQDPKERLGRLRAASLYGRVPRTKELRRRMGENASLDVLRARSPSFKRFMDATCTAVERLYQG